MDSRARGPSSAAPGARFVPFWVRDPRETKRLCGAEGISSGKLGVAMLKTKFTELVGCTVPIQQAGMGDLSPPRLAAAVADAGALGMVGLTNAPLSYVVKSLDETRHLTSGAFGANFIYPGLVDESTGKIDPELAGVVEAAASRARVVEFFYGTPDPALVEEVHAGGALVSWQVGSRDEAIAAERTRCDLIVAQGTEAGGPWPRRWRLARPAFGSAPGSSRQRKPRPTLPIWRSSSPPRRRIRSS